jgi:ABC-2 type transport system ATP-binding protein
MIEAGNLRKSFFVHKKEPGILGSMKSLVSRQRIERVAVNDVSFRVEQGEIVGLIGANGAGKTTLIKMLAGIIHPTSGEASVLGYQPWRRQNEFRRQIALIMGQKAQLWWDLPAADCFLLLREIYEVPPAEFDSRLDRLTSVLGVKDLLNIQVRRLSLGERMKMELIAALLHNPRVVFLDEPTIGLDINAQRAIREFILEYQRESRPAIILTSHYMEDIERLCPRIMIIREGGLVYDGSLQEVVRRYANYKVLTAHLQEGQEGRVRAEDLTGVGAVLGITGATVRLHVPRDRAAQAAAELVRLVPVSDINIEEEEIGSIIAKIMTHQG